MALTIRAAERRDLPTLVRLLSQLSLETPRESLTEPLQPAYERAIDEVLADPRQTLLVADADGIVVGMASFVLVPNLSHLGRPWALVEDVVVDALCRGRGVGEALMRHAIALAREHGCYKLTLTSNKARIDAHRFYERLGFQATHLGFRIDL